MGIKNTLEKFGLIEKVSDSPEDSLEEDIVAAMEEMPAMEEPKVEKKEEREKKQEPVDFKKLELLALKEIYKKYQKEADGANSVFIVEKFSNALPGYLPQDVRRESVSNIVATSGIKLNYLLGDGQERLQLLKEYSQGFTRQAKEMISKYEAEIKQLNEKIEQCRKAIGEIDSTKKEQTAILEYEMERITNIIEFINPKNNL